MTPAGPTVEQVGRFAADVRALTGASPGALGIALSGGPDSVALLLLAISAFSDHVRAATVDHELRPESGDEAASAARLCAALGLDHSLLRPASPITGNLPSAARAARYRLLEAWRVEKDLDWVMTAHHADDQAETLVMRLNRCSGLAGLSGIRAVNGRLLRPLLGWRRAELAEIARFAPVPPVDDSSNRDPRFDRARLRNSLASVDWIDPPSWSRSASALAEAEQALDYAVARIAAERVSDSPSAIRLDPSGLPREIVRRLVLQILARFSADAPPRGEALARLIATLEAGGTATLAGIQATGGDIWSFTPAPPRRR